MCLVIHLLLILKVFQFFLFIKNKKNITVFLVHSLVLKNQIYHWVVSINRPSGYEPDALPLRHDDGLSFGGFDPPPLDSLVCDHTLLMGGFDPPPLILSSTLPLHYNDLFDKCPAVAHICHRLHYVQINHINYF